MAAAKKVLCQLIVVSVMILAMEPMPSTRPQVVNVNVSLLVDIKIHNYGSTHTVLSKD